MAETLSTMLAIPFTTAVTSWGLTVTDQAGAGRTVTINPTGLARVYRIYLANAHGVTPGTNAGTEADPDELLSHLQTQLNAALANLWTVALNATGYVVLTYNGTGTGNITWPADLTIRNALGITATTTGNLASGASYVAPFNPMFCAYSIARINDSGWTTLPQKFFGAEMPGGLVYGWGDNQHRAMRSFDLRFHPPGTAMAGMPAVSGALATPLYPVVPATLLAPSRAMSGAGSAVTLPWSLYETLKTVAGVRIAVALGNFQAMVAGTDGLYSTGYLALDTVNASGAIKPSIGTYAGRWDWSGVKLLFAQQLTR